jgi:hypothetical protein
VSLPAAELPKAAERPHAGALHEEWTWSFWASDASLGGFVSYRLVGTSNAWYTWALARVGHPLLHVTEWDIPRRSDPMLAKAQAMWAEFVCEAPFEQWTVGNETYAVELDDPAEALGRAYGTAVPIASDIEWYATAPPSLITDGYEQAGVVHGSVELTAGPLDFAELPAHRTHRWSASPLQPLQFDRAYAHVGLAAPIRFPDGSEMPLVLTSGGWRTR